MSSGNNFSIKVLVYPLSSLSSSSDSIDLSNFPLNNIFYKLGLPVGILHSSILYNNEWEIEYGQKGIDIRRYEPGKYKVLRIFDIGSTTWQIGQIRDLINNDLAKRFNSNTYKLMSNNCQHFCNELIKRISGREIPEHLKNLAVNTASFTEYAVGTAHVALGAAAVVVGAPVVVVAALGGACTHFALSYLWSKKKN